MRFDADPPPRGPSLPLWSFRDDVAIEVAGDGSLTILTQWHELHLDRPAPPITDVLSRMTYGPVSLGNVTGLDLDALAQVFDSVPGCVVRSLGLPGSAAPLLSVHPVSPRGVFELPDVTDERPIRLSRYAFVREQDAELVLESPLSHYRVALHRQAASWAVASLAGATTSAETARRLNLARPLVTEIVAHLVAAGMVVLGEEGAGTPRFAEDNDPALFPWSPHDLLFHSRSRLGRHDNPVGATFRHVNAVPPPPVAKPVPDGPRFPLYRPEPGALAEHGMSLTELIERRRSVRRFADCGPSARQLGELLYRTARIRSQAEVVDAGGVPYTVSRRPYPSAGSLYELELYLTIDRSDDLPRGSYHYSPANHALVLVNDNPANVDEMLDNAMVFTGGSRPPTLITMTARMGRLSWVYESISYATALKHVGVLQQTLYLVATGLGLAGCALVTGDSDAAASALCLDCPAEISVGEFAIGLPIATKRS